MIKVKVTGFMPQENVDISWNANGGQSLTSLYTDQKGAAQQGQIWPPSAPLGSYTLTARGDSGVQATSNICIGPGIRVDGNGIPGFPLSVVGGGFTPGETVKVYVQSTQNGVVKVTVDDTGSFTTTINVPNFTYDSSNPYYYVYAKSTTSTNHSQAKFRLSPPGFIPWGLTAQGSTSYNALTEINGWNFGFQEDIDIIWGYQQPGQQTIMTVTSGWDGEFGGQFLAPSFDQRTVTIAAVGKSSHIVKTFTVDYYAAVYLTPVDREDRFAHGNPGDEITVSGGGFGANHTITVAWRGAPILTTNSNSDGVFAAQITVPEVNGSGDPSVTATDSTSNITASTVFYYVPSLTVEPNSIHKGDQVTISGSRFPANTLICVYGPRDPYSPMPGPGTSYDILHCPTTDADGNFTFTYTITGSPGSYYVRAQDYYDYVMRAFAPLTILE